MTASSTSSIAILMRVCLFAAIFVGPLGAIALQQERGFGDSSNAIGLVLIKSLQRG